MVDVPEFESLIERFQGKVFRLAYSMVGDRAAAEDLSQEVFVRIWKALPGYRGESSLATWVFAIARNACLSRRRREAARRAASLDVAAVRAEAERLGRLAQEAFKAQRYAEARTALVEAIRLAPETQKAGYAETLRDMEILIDLRTKAAVVRKQPKR